MMILLLCFCIKQTHFIAWVALNVRQRYTCKLPKKEMLRLSLILAMLIILAKVFRVTIHLQLCGLSVLRNRILLKLNTILRIAI